MENRFKLFTVLNSKINRCIRKIKTDEMAEFELKSTHVSCLYYLYVEDTLTAKELCDICDEDKGAISRSLDYLENSGYLKCDSKTVKRYKSPIELTEKGKLVAKKISEKIDRVLDEASVGLTEENRVVFYQSLSLISENLEKICDKQGE